MLGIIAAVGVVCAFAIVVCLNLDDHPNGVCSGGPVLELTCSHCRRFFAERVGVLLVKRERKNEAPTITKKKEE